MKSTTAKVKLNVLEGGQRRPPTLASSSSPFSGFQPSALDALVETSQRLVGAVQTQLLLQKELARSRDNERRKRQSRAKLRWITLT